jgi:hypothetical protein
VQVAKAYLLVAEEDFAAADELVVDPDAVFVADGFGAGARGTSLQAHSGRRLENVRAEWTAVHVELDAKIASIAEPGNLVAGIEHDGFGEDPDENGAVSHGESLQSTVKSSKFAREVLARRVCALTAGLKNS